MSAPSSAGPSRPGPPGRVPARLAARVERHGIDTIPDAERTSRPRDLFRIQFGGANTFATILLGTIPVALGLSFWQAVAATVTGVVVGALVLAPMGLFGPRTGTNNAVSSGAHFGVRGRVVGSFLSLLTAVAFYSISVWVSGDALVGAVARLTGSRAATSDGARALVYAALGALVIVVVVYGYQLMLLVNRVVVVANTVLVLLGAVAFAGVFDPAYDPGPAATAELGLTATFVLSALIVMGNPVSFGAFLGDWSRYIPADTPRRALIGATLAAQLMTLVPFLFGVATATVVAGEADYVVALVAAAPAWYAVALVPLAFLGGMSTGVTSLYGTGLDFSSVFPRLSRIQASLVIGVVAFAFILVGRLVFDLLTSVNAFIGLIVICTTPWMVIMTIGYVVRRGHYDPADLQVFNQGRTGGRYWFTGGVALGPMAAWIGAAGVGLLFGYYPPLLVGPLSGVAGGVDVSLPVALVLAAGVYLALLRLRPEPRAVFGPRGPAGVPADDRAAAPPEVSPARR